MSAPSAVDPARSTDTRRLPKGKVVGVGLLAAALSAALVWLVTLGVAEPSRLDVTIANPTDYFIDVHVRPADGGGGHGIGTLAPRSTRTFQGISDQGERWSFDFAYAGVEGATVTVPRHEVAADAIEVPAEVAAKFEQAGLRGRPARP